MQVDVGIGIDIPLETMTSTDIDLTIYSLLWYAFTISTITINLYNLIKPLVKRKLKTYDLEFGYDDKSDRIVEKEVAYINLWMPLVICLIVVHTISENYFTYMPFRTYWLWLDRIYSGVIFGSIANGLFTSYNMIKELGLSLVGRIIGIKRYS